VLRRVLELAMAPPRGDQEPPVGFKHPRDFADFHRASVAVDPRRREAAGTASLTGVAKVRRWLTTAECSRGLLAMPCIPTVLSFFTAPVRFGLRGINPSASRRLAVGSSHSLRRLVARAFLPPPGLPPLDATRLPGRLPACHGRSTNSTSAVPRPSR
jgi:hypothetical protein